MATQIFVNLPVSNLTTSIEFFTALGYTFNPQFTDETATCMIISENIFAMLITHNRFKDFTKKEIANARTSAEVIVSLSAESRTKVDEMADKALKAGGTVANEPSDMGFMYNRSFNDPDGHLWEIFWMDPNGMQR